MDNQNTSRQLRYLEEVRIPLHRAGFGTLPAEGEQLPVLWNGAPLCRITGKGSVFYRREDVDTPQAEDALYRVEDIAAKTLEYMTAMEAAPQLKASGLDGDYRILADFGGTVLAGSPSKYGVQFVTWDWDYYGLRRSEVLGLRWSAIDMEHKTISISHKVIEAEVDGKFVPMGEDVLKTKSSFRTLPLIPAVGIILLEEKEKQEMYRRLFKKSYCRDYLDYICVDQCGKLLRPNYVTEHFSWLIEKYGLRKVRFHDLRHTCASLLLSNGISMKQIQIWLGHSTFSTTADIYAHLDYSAQEASANAMSGMFNRPEKEEQLA